MKKKKRSLEGGGRKRRRGRESFKQEKMSRKTIKRLLNLKGGDLVLRAMKAGRHIRGMGARNPEHLCGRSQEEGKKKARNDSLPEKEVDHGP